MDGESRPAEPEESFSVEALEGALFAHAAAAAERAQRKLGGPLTGENLEWFLRDRDCLRYETGLVFDREGLDAHQFAESFFEEAADGERRCRLHVDPRFEGRPEVLHFLVAYMAAVINYGHVASAELCERYGAALVGMGQEAFYQRVCDLFDGRA